MTWSRNPTYESFDKQYEYLGDPFLEQQTTTQDAYIRIYKIMVKCSISQMFNSALLIKNMFLLMFKAIIHPLW